MKKFSLTISTILIPIVVLASLLSGCTLVQPQAEVNITDNIPGYDGDWYMEIYFTIVNTGLYNIVSYDITFEVTCTDETRFNDEYWGSSLARGESHSDMLTVYTGSKEPATARYSNLELEAE
jgi:hypothetical protein